MAGRAIGNAMLVKADMGERPSVRATRKAFADCCRNEARASKDWATADRVRDELTAMGIVLEDADGKTRWRRKDG